MYNVWQKHKSIVLSRYQTSQIGNRTMRWLKTVLEKQTKQQRLAKPFFAYIGPHAPHYPATPAPWYETRFPDVTIPITPNYNLSSPDKTQHIRQNPPLTAAAKCWEDQHFRDRWRTLLSVDELVGDVFAALTAANVLDNTYIFYSSDHGYKQGQWRVGTSKEHPYDTDIRVPLLARGPGIQPGSTYNYPSGNVDLTPTLLTLAAGAAYVPAPVNVYCFSVCLPACVCVRARACVSVSLCVSLGLCLSVAYTLPGPGARVHGWEVAHSFSDA